MKKQSVVVSTAVILFVFFTCVLLKSRSKFDVASSSEDYWWQIQSIDTVKYSRDVAREKEADDTFDMVINDQVNKIAKAGTTHIAIGTPYDAEFTPFLQKWVRAARQNGLKVWFRGNLSGWEGWFGYNYINSQQHTDDVKQFILLNRDLFEDGDVFDPCPECENGNWGDPRGEVDLLEYRKFLINEYSVCTKAFEEIGKDVRIVYSMNGDVASLVMDKPTTQKLGGVVTVDHYVNTTNQLVSDVNKLAEKSGGKVLLGEFGAPIPDIHGDVSEENQAQWIDNLLDELSKDTSVLGINYWTSFGSSTSLWRNNATEKPAVSILAKYFKPQSSLLRVTDELGRALKDVSVSVRAKQSISNASGKVNILFIEHSDQVLLTKKGYIAKKVSAGDVDTSVVMQKEEKGFWYSLAKKVYKFFGI